MRRGTKHTERALRKMSKTHKGKSAGSRNPMWKGGITFDGRYLRIHVPHHPDANTHGYVYLHRLLAGYYIGRPLYRAEAVHHVNEDKTDNRPVNLMVFKTQSDHQSFERGKGCPKENILYDGRER